MDRAAWETLIAGAARPLPVGAHTFLRAWGSHSRPVALRCDDDQEYVVKGRAVDRPMERALINEQVIGHIAALLEAPVPRIGQVNVPQELIAAEPQMRHMHSGLAHAMALIADCSDKSGVDLANIAENRPRFAALAILFSWAGGGDQQLIYTNSKPRYVYSVDHGHFFPSGPDWRVEHLAAAEGEVLGPHPYFASCGLGDGDLRQPLAKLDAVRPEDIAAAVARPPDAWNIDMSTRVSLAIFLAKRRETLLRLQPKEEAHG